MKPPWKEYPDVPMTSAGWRMGHGESYMQRWNAWYRALTPDERCTYQKAWCEPPGWAGFYGYIDGGTVPASVAEYRTRLEEPQKPPLPSERRISDYFRAQWLARHYLKRVDEYQVRSRYPSPYIGERTGELLMGFYEEPDGSWWRLSNPTTGGIEMLRIDDELLRDWNGRPV